MRTLMERFVLGHQLNNNRDIKELGTRDMDQEMRGFWELRSQGRMYETRMFGFFARPGAFVGLRFAGKSLLETDEDYVREHGTCKLLWTSLFSDSVPLKEPWPVLSRAQLEGYTDRNDG